MDIYGYKFVNIIETKPLCHIGITDLSGIVCFFIRLEQSVAAHRDHFVRRLSVCACVCLSDSHTFLIVHSYVSQATHAFLGMLPLCSISFQRGLVNQNFVFIRKLYFTYSIIRSLFVLIDCQYALFLFKTSYLTPCNVLHE